MKNSPEINWEQIPLTEKEIEILKKVFFNFLIYK